MVRPPEIETLRQRLREQLPGLAARAPLSPLPDRGRLSATIPAAARPAAVLMLLVPGPSWAMPMIRRPEVVGDTHSGQISLPGGSFEAGEDAVAAALRETREEIGLEPDSIEILGELAPQWIPVSGYVVHPVVGWAPSVSRLVCDPAEVDLGFWMDFGALCHAPVLERPLQRGPRTLIMRGWELDQGFLWGATAMMLAELRAIVLAQ